MSAQGCHEPDQKLCGPCGSIVTGQLSIANDARFDGFFTAVALARDAVNDIHADFEAEVLALAAIYGLPAGEV
ncbi:MAG: hypothetical protein R3A51_23260, partial [Nannocystaceae bacterium]